MIGAIDNFPSSEIQIQKVLKTNIISRIILDIDFFTGNKVPA